MNNKLFLKKLNYLSQMLVRIQSSRLYYIEFTFKQKYMDYITSNINISQNEKNVNIFKIDKKKIV